MSQTRFYKFDTESFEPSQPIKEFLKSKGTISHVFGDIVFINSQAMYSVLVELIEISKMNSQLRHSIERLQQSYQELRSEAAEALTNLKILEEENEILTQELERLSQSKNIPTKH